MKKTLMLVALIVAAVIVPLKAQAEFRFGVKAGLNVNKLNFNETDFGEENRCGFTGGVMTEFTLPLIGIGMDLSVMYTRMNSDLNLYADGFTGVVGMPEEVERGKDFIEIPLNLKYKLNIPVINSIIRPYFVTGPDFAFKLNKDTWDKMKTKTCQVAWNVGLGVELFKHLQVGASYAFGINNIADHWVDIDPDTKLRNNYWTITAAYLF